MTKSPEFLTGAGIGVSDLERSAAFYIEFLGMHQAATFKLPHMDEIMLMHEGRGTALVLMHYTDGSTRNYQDNPVKVIFYVSDVNAIVERLRAKGQAITREPMFNKGLNANIAFAKDPDGYDIELIQALSA